MSVDMIMDMVKVDDPEKKKMLLIYLEFSIWHKKTQMSLMITAKNNKEV